MLQRWTSFNLLMHVLIILYQSVLFGRQYNAIKPLSFFFPLTFLPNPHPALLQNIRKSAVKRYGLPKLFWSADCHQLSPWLVNRQWREIQFLCSPACLHISQVILQTSLSCFSRLKALRPRKTTHSFMAKCFPSQHVHLPFNLSGLAECLTAVCLSSE